MEIELLVGGVGDVVIRLMLNFMSKLYEWRVKKTYMGKKLDAVKGSPGDVFESDHMCAGHFVRSCLGVCYL